MTSSSNPQYIDLYIGEVVSQLSARKSPKGVLYLPFHMAWMACKMGVY